MLLKYFYDQKLAQASYMVGCQETGEALVIDPARDVSPYLHTADAEGLTITQVTETHIHADFVSGVRELAAQTGATLYLSDMGDADWKYAYADHETVLLHDGDSWMLGNIRLEAIHTPGHTPEHLMFQLTDTRAADRPMGLFTGRLLVCGRYWPSRPAGNRRRDNRDEGNRRARAVRQYPAPQVHAGLSANLAGTRCGQRLW